MRCSGLVSNYGGDQWENKARIAAKAENSGMAEISVKVGLLTYRSGDFRV